MRTMIRLRSDFVDTIAQHGIGTTEMADLAEIARPTLYALLNPAIQPRRRGGMHRTTAWKIAHAFAARTHIEPRAAWNMLLEEVPGDQSAQG